MPAIEEVMHNYFSERIELNHVQQSIGESFRKKYFSAEYLADMHKEWDRGWEYTGKHPAVILSVEDCGEFAVVITLEPEGDEQQYRCYNLNKTGDGWNIARKGRRCFFCEGTGRNDEGHCLYCKGKGWRLNGPLQR